MDVDALLAGDQTALESLESGISENIAKSLCKSFSLVEPSSGQSAALGRVLLRSLINGVDTLDALVALSKVRSISSAVLSLLGQARRLDDRFVYLVRGIRRMVELEGPDVFFRFMGGIMEIEGHRIGPRGWSVSLCVRVIADGSLLAILSQNGGIFVRIVTGEIEVGVPGSNGTVIAGGIRDGEWVSIILVHELEKTKSSTRSGRMSCYLNGEHHGSVMIPYPKDGHSVVTIGGLLGDIGPVHFFQRALSQAQVTAIQCSSPSFSPSFLARGLGNLSRFVSFENPALGYISGTDIRLSPKNHLDGTILPDHWPDETSARVKLPQGVQVVSVPNVKKDLFTKGGLKLLYLTLSPQDPMLGKEFASAEEACETLYLLAELIRENPANLYQLIEFGALTVRQYILVHVTPEDRNALLVDGVKTVLDSLESLIISPVIQVTYATFLKVLLLDLSYWVLDIFQDNVLVVQQGTLMLICSIARDLIIRHYRRTEFTKVINPSFFLNQLRSFAPAYFKKPVDSELAQESDNVLPPDAMTVLITITEEIMLCICTLTESPVLITDELVEEVCFTLDECTEPAIQRELILLLIHFANRNLELVVDVLLRKFNDGVHVYQFLINKLSCPIEDVRVLSVKLLGCLLIAVRTRKRFTFSQEISVAITLLLSSFKFTETMFKALLQLLIGRIDLSLVSSHMMLDDDVLFEFPAFLSVIFTLAQQAPLHLKERVLLDILTMLKTQSDNTGLFAKLHFWQRFLIPFLADFQSEEHTVVSQLTIQILQSVLWHCISSDDMGWLALDQAAWCLGQIPKFTLDTYAIQITIALQLISPLSRMSMETAKPTQTARLSSVEESSRSNLRMVFSLVETWMFLDPASFQLAPREPTTDEVLLLNRYLSVLMLFSSRERQKTQIIRVLLRYVENILPLASCSEVHPLILESTISLFSDVTSVSSTPDAIYSVRCAFMFLTASMETCLRLDFNNEANDIKSVISSIFCTWDRLAFSPPKIPMRGLTPRASRSQLPDMQIGLPDVQESISDSLINIEDVTDSILQDALFFIYQIKNDNPCFQWWKDEMSMFVDSLDKRNQKSQTRLTHTEDGFDSHLKELEARVVDLYLTKTDLSEDWALVALRLDSVPNKDAKNDTERLYYAGRMLKNYRVDMQSKLYAFDDISDNPTPCEGGFWKLDRTENPLRMRPALRRNLYGHSHESATITSKVSSKARKTSVDDLQFAAALAHLRSSDDLRDEADDDARFLPEEEIDIGLGDDFPSEPISDDEDPDVGSMSAEKPTPRQHHSTAVSVRANEKEKSETDETSTEKARATFSCTMVTPRFKVTGMFSVYSKKLEFVGDQYEDMIPLKPDWDEFSCYGLHGLKQRKKVTIRLRDVRLVLPRRHLLRQSAIEVFLKTHRSYFFNFSKAARNDVFRLVCDMVHLPPVLNPQRRVQYSSIVDRWRTRRMSNFDYLMHLNTLAGRSYNDITQYPIFPWVLSDYTSEVLDLSNPASFRDLSKPIGALNPERLPVFLEKYRETSETPEFPAWHYGSHYSSAGTVLHYLLRLEPYTTLGVNMQGGKFDLPDRLFTSMAGTWDLSYSNVSDVKELIPEFYYLPEFLTNTNKLGLGCTQEGHPVDNVKLPPWASSPEDFIRKHREALECEYVSQRLPMWIDLIFGYKQRGSDAVRAVNVFFHLTYEDSVDIDAIEDDSLREATEAQVAYFGQTPSQLFTKPHLAREPPNSYDFINRLSFPFELPMNYAPIFLYGIQRDGVCTLVKQKLRIFGDSLVHCCISPELGLVSYTRSILPLLGKFSRASPDLYATTSNDSEASHPVSLEGRRIRLLHPEFHPQVVDISRNAKFIFSSGYSNNSVKCHVTATGTTVSSVQGHCSKVTCISLGHDQSSLVTGAVDGSVTLWAVYTRNYDPNHLPPLVNGENHIFSEHSSPVVDVSHDYHLGVIASISAKELVTYSFNRKRVIRGISFASHISPKFVQVFRSPYIAVAAVVEDSWILYLYSLNGKLLFTRPHNCQVTVLRATFNQEYLMVGDSNGLISILNAYDLETAWEVDCNETMLGEQSNAEAQREIIRLSFDLIPTPSDETISLASLSERNDVEDVRRPSISNDDSDTLLTSVPQLPLGVADIEVSPGSSIMFVARTDGSVLFYALPSLFDLTRVFPSVTISVVEEYGPESHGVSEPFSPIAVQLDSARAMMGSIGASFRGFFKK